MTNENTLHNRSLWKQFVKEGRGTRQEMFRYCLIKALHAKSNMDKAELAKILLKKAFTPIVNAKRLANGAYPWQTVVIMLQWERHYLASYKRNKVEYSEFLKNTLPLLDYTAYNDLVEKVHGQFNNKSFDTCEPYTYIFVRQDLAPEYQLVQAAHATMLMGAKIGGDTSKINFVISGVPSLEDLKETKEFLGRKEIKFEAFNEPDIGNEDTAICTYPITNTSDRAKLKRFRLLKFV